MKTYASILAGSLLFSSAALAQQATRVIILNGSTAVSNSNPLPVAVISGGLSGSTSNASSGVATSSTNVPTVSYNYVFNGTTWDQLSSITVGTKHAPTVAIVDASGNQITSFGGNATIVSPVGAGNSAAAVRTTTASDDPLLTAVQSPIPTQAPTVSIGGVGIVDSAGTNVATVKAASTIPVATDKTLVVGLNPGTAIAGSPTGAILTVQGVTSMTKLLVTPDSVALPANQSVNVSQINGVTPLMGSGNTGTGSPRVTLPTDQLALAAWGLGATGATAPVGAQLSGGRAASAAPTEVTDGQMVALQTSLGGKLINLPYSIKETVVSGGTAAMTGTTSTSVIASAGGSLRNYITACTFSNSHATVGTMMLLQDGSGGATLWTAPAAAVFGGAQVIFPTPIKTTAATGLFVANVTTGANTFVYCTGYTGI